MAEQAVSSVVAAAVASEVTNRVFTGLIEKFSKQAAAGEKLQRLEMLLIKIHSAVEASEKHAIGNSWLVQWRDKLKEAALQGDEVLAVFRQRAEGVGGQAIDNANQLPGASPPPPPPSSSSSSSSSSSAAAATASSGALSFTRKSLSGMVHVIRDAAKTLFSSDSEAEKLNVAVERLEKLSADIGEFIRLLRLEVLPKLEQSRAAGRKRRPPSPPSPSRAGTFGARGALEWRPCRTTAPADLGPAHKVEAAIRAELRSDAFGVSRPPPVKTWIAETAEYKEEFQVWRVLLRELAEASGKISRATEVAGERELDGLGALAQWAAVLREALQRAHTARIGGYHLLRHRRGLGGEEVDERQRGVVTVEQMYSLVRSVEMLAGEVDSFSSLVDLCPYAPSD